MSDLSPNLGRILCYIIFGVKLANCCRKGPTEQQSSLVVMALDCLEVFGKVA